MNLVVVDIQPAYKDKIYRAILENLEAEVNKADNVFWYYNGKEVGIDDEHWEILEMTDLNNYINKIHFEEKDYGFLRGWMDTGTEDEIIINAIKTLQKKNLVDSRDHEGLNKINNNEPLIIPDIKLPPWKEFSLVGGGRYECLKEMYLLFKANSKNPHFIQNVIYD